MFANLIHSSVAALAFACLPCAPSLPEVATAPAAEATMPPELMPLPVVSAILYIENIGGGYYRVSVSGTSSRPNATLGVRVMGEDTWFDDHLFSMGYYSRTDPSGYFSVSQVVHRNVLNEDWEGRDEVYAVAEVSGAGSARTNTIRQYF